MNASHSCKRVLYVGILSGLILSLTAIFSVQIRAASPAKGSGGAANVPAATQRVVLPLQIRSVILNPTSVTGGTAQVVGTVTLNQPAPAGGMAVVLRSSNSTIAAVPPGVTVQPGATAATFIVTTFPVAMNPNVVTGPPSVQISAQAGNSSPVIAQLTVLPPTIASLTLNPATVAGGSGSTGTVTITGPAPSGGLVVILTSNVTPSASTSPSRALPVPRLSQPSVSLPQQVTIPAGAASASFVISPRDVSASTSVNITAAWGVFSMKTAMLTLLPPGIASMELDPIMCGPGGNPCTGTITLTGPAPYEGMTFYLRTRNTPNPHCGELPTVPRTVTIAGGSLSAAFPVTTSPGYGYYVIEVSQIANFPAQATGGKVFWVSAPPFSLEVPQSVKGGNAVQGMLRLTGAAMSSNCGNRYTLASSNANVAQAPPYMDVTPGGTQAAFPITTAALSTAAGPQSVTIYVTGPFGFKAEQQTREKTLTVTP